MIGDIMKQKVDLRILKTKNSLYSALAKLLEEMPFEKLKVSDICEKALVNRSTFYAHFADKYELFDAYVKDLKQLLLLELNKNDHYANLKEYYMEMLNLFLGHMEEKKQIYAAIFWQNKNSIIMDMIYNALKENVQTHLEKMENSNIPSDILTKFYLGAIFSICMEWLTHNVNYTKEELTSFIDQLIPDLEQKKRKRISLYFRFLVNMLNCTCYNT